MTNVKTDGLEDYNPFTDNFKQSQPAIMNTENINNGSQYQSNEATSLIASTKRVVNYKQFRKEPEEDTCQENNWPQFPEFCPCQPCFYHNISKDIPESMQSLVRAAYSLWIGYSITMLFNVLGALAYFLSTGKMEAGSTFGMSIVMAILLPVLIFLGWYRPLYNAAKVDSSVSYFIYFLSSFGQVVIVSIQCVGINWFGACGWLNSTIVLVKYRTAGVIMLFIATLFTVILVGHVILLIQVHRKYRNIDINTKSMTKDTLNTDLKRSDSIREIAAASMKSGTNYVLEDLKEIK